MTLQRQPNQAVDQILVLQTRSPPQLRIHGNARESRHRVNFVEIDASPGTLAGGLHQEVDPRQTSTIARPESSQRHCADLFLLRHRQLCRDDRQALIRTAELVLGLVVVELLRGDDFANNRSLRSVITEHRNLQLSRLRTRPPNPLLNNQFAIKRRGKIHRSGQF